MGSFIMLSVILTILSFSVVEVCWVRTTSYKPYSKQFDSQDVSLTETAANAVSTLVSFQCGESRILSPNRILGGSNALYGQFPWIVLLHIVNGPVKTMCAGSLVSSRHVITAAHCVDKVDITVTLVFGELDYMHRHSSQDILTKRALDIFIHPLYTASNNNIDSPRFDMAVILLDTPVLNISIYTPICLPSPQIRREKWKVGVVAGWGRTTTASSVISSTSLQTVSVPILSSDLCARQPGGSFPSPDQLCAGLSGDVSGPCPGDSGAPLMVKMSDGLTWILLGVVSYGPKECGLTPVIYSSVLHNIDWIQAIINQI